MKTTTNISNGYEASSSPIQSNRHDRLVRYNLARERLNVRYGTVLASAQMHVWRRLLEWKLARLNELERYRDGK